MIESEKQAEIDRILERVAKEAEMDFEALEFYVRTAVLALGCGILEKVLEGVGAGRRSEALMCECGNRMESQGLRVKTIRTILGPVRFRRSRYTCCACGVARIPGDELLGCLATSFSPGARRMMARAGSRESFKESAEDLQLYAKLDVDPKDIERVAEEVGRRVSQWMESEGTKARCYEACELVPPDVGEPAEILYVSFDGTGVPMRREELQNTKGKQGEAKTREVKLGCVFTQTALDKEGRPVREPASTTYLGAIEDSETFGWRIWAESLRRGLRQAGKTAVITDGAAYNKTIIAKHLPNATHIIDLYHARERLCKFVKLFVTAQEQQALREKWLALLDQGKVETLVAQMKSVLPRSGPRRKDGLCKTKYFEENAQQMRYKDFRDQGLFVGSGVVEAGCKTLIAKRLKNSGMFWSLDGANAIIALRCCQYSRRFEQFWEDTVA